MCTNRAEAIDAESDTKSCYSKSCYVANRLFSAEQSDKSEGSNLKFCMVEAVHMTFPVVVNW